MEIDETIKTNDFTFHYSLKEMFLSFNDCKISLEEIYTIIEETNKKEEIKVEVNQPLMIYLEKYGKLLLVNEFNDLFFSFSIEQKIGIKLLRKKIIAKYQNKQIEFVSPEQFTLFKNQFKLTHFNCSCSKKPLQLNFYKLCAHENHQIDLVNYYQIKNYNSEELVKNILNHPNEFIHKKFDSPESFEKNFKYYFHFNNQKQINGEFEIFEDKEKIRRKLSLQLSMQINFGEVLHYFGSSGKGKTVTLIGTLKYLVNHNFYGTFYINCKSLRILLKKNMDNIVKEILIDEIAYLYPNQYDVYVEFCEMIKNFNFYDSFSFWDLIQNILEKCNMISWQYIIGFDQYNNSNDKNNKLSFFKNNIFKKNNKFKVIVFSSMNENDIREIKINTLFDQKSNLNMYIEIDEIFNNLEINFSNNEEKEIFIKLGKTLKAYNEIKINKYNLQGFLDEKKKKYLCKIISFYSKESIKNYNQTIEKLLDIKDDYYYKLLSFKINEPYSKKELKNIIDNIPFRFFNIYDFDEDEYYIIPNFPLIDEIIKDIYNFLIINRNYFVQKNLFNNKGNALGTLFEYKVIYHLSPNLNNIPTITFNNFTITKSIKIKVLIPKKNQNLNKIKFIQKLDKGITYLILQEDFGGKDLDFLIINMVSDEPNIYGIQVSIHKVPIFTRDYLLKSYDSLIQVLKKSFQLKINLNNLYFGYIFDYSRKTDNDYIKMIDNCKKEKLLYAFFNINDNKLYLKDHNELKDINEFVIKVYDNTTIYRNLDITKMLQNYKNYEISDEEIQKIINLLSNELKKSIKNLTFIKKTDRIEYSNNYVFINFSNKNQIIILFFQNNKINSKIITLNETKNINQILTNKFDKYQIIYD